MSWYCDVAPGDPVHRPYHEHEYGFPARDETVLFERLALEIFQAGLSWKLILQKRDALNAAFHRFDVDTVAAYDATARARLLADKAIIRNRAKIDAVIANAGTVQELRSSYGGFAALLAAHHPLSHAAWTRLFRRTFRFTGPELVGEFLMSLGYLPGAHKSDCPVYARTLAADPPWARAVAAGFQGYDSA